MQTSSFCRPTEMGTPFLNTIEFYSLGKRGIGYNTETIIFISGK